MERRHEITFETEEILILRTSVNVHSLFCNECSATVRFVSAYTAAVIVGSTEREIFRLLEKGSLHFVDAEQVLVCVGSLRQFNKPERGKERNETRYQISDDSDDGGSGGGGDLLADRKSAVAE